MNAMFIYYLKWSLFTIMYCCIFGSENYTGGLLKMSRLIYGGRGLFTLKVQKVQYLSVFFFFFFFYFALAGLLTCCLSKA